MEVFIFKLLSVDALTTSAIVVGEVTSLDHELLDDCQKQHLKSDDFADLTECQQFFTKVR